MLGLSCSTLPGLAQVSLFWPHILFLNFTHIIIQAWDFWSWTYSLPESAPIFADIEQPGTGPARKWPFYILPILALSWPSTSRRLASNPTRDAFFIKMILKLWNSIDIVINVGLKLTLTSLIPYHNTTYYNSLVATKRGAGDSLHIVIISDTKGEGNFQNELSLFNCGPSLLPKYIVEKALYAPE